MPARKGRSERGAASPAEPLYKRIATQLARRIVAGEYPAGSQLPEERRLVSHFDASRYTIRQALDLLQAQGIIQRAPNKGTFVLGSHQHARWFSTASGILLVRAGPDGSQQPAPGSYYARIYEGVESASRSMGLDLKVEALLSPVSVPLQRYQPPRRDEVGGVLVCGTFDEQYISMYRSEQVPVVAIDYWSSSLETDCVAIDIEAEAPAIIEHLAVRGHTRLGFVGVARHDHQRDVHELDPDTWRLLDSLRRAASHRGIDIRDDWILMHYRGWQGRTLASLLTCRPRPTAVVCFTGEPVTAMLQTLQKLSLRCPEDVSIITRGDADVDGRQTTCLVADPREMGRMAVRLLVERMKGQRTCTVKLAIATRLVQGTTTGPAPRS